MLAVRVAGAHRQKPRLALLRSARVDTIELGHFAYAVVGVVFVLDVYIAFFWGKRPKKNERPALSGRGNGPHASEPAA